MPRAVLSKSVLVVLFTCFITSGCVVFQPHHFLKSEFANPSLQPGVTADKISEIPTGARVKVIHQTGNSVQQIIGVVIQSSPQGLALMNCDQQTSTEHDTPIMNRIPYVSRLFKTTGYGHQRIPVLRVPIRDMTFVNIIEVSESDQKLPQLPIDTNDELFFERIGVDFNSSDQSTTSLNR